MVLENRLQSLWLKVYVIKSGERIHHDQRGQVFAFLIYMVNKSILPVPKVLCRGSKKNLCILTQTISGILYKLRWPKLAWKLIMGPQPSSAKLGGYDFYRQVLGSPRYVLAPMVDQSELVSDLSSSQAPRY